MSNCYHIDIMKKLIKTHTAHVLCVFCLMYASAAMSSPRIEANIPTIDQEASVIWQTIHDIRFFEKHGYDISLPTHELIDELVQKSKAGNFSNQDYFTIYRLLDDEVYDKKAYRTALFKVKNQASLINRISVSLVSMSNNWDWHFKRFDTYQVVLTLYGSGGRYDPDTGQITLMADRDGNFKRYENPANTIVHEIVHIGIENSLVNTFSLPHSIKEELVDRIVLNPF